MECLKQNIQKQMQKTIEDKINEQSTKYSNWKMQIETKPGSTCYLY